MVKKSVSYCENIITKFIKAPVIEKILYLLVIIIIVNLIANYVPAQNSLLNFFPRTLDLKKSAIVITIIGFIVGMLWLPLLSQIGILI